MCAGYHGMGNGGGGGGIGGGGPDDEGTLFGAASERAAFKAAIHSTTHRIGRHLGFQAYCAIPESQVRSFSVQDSAFRYLSGRTVHDHAALRTMAR